MLTVSKYHKNKLVILHETDTHFNTFKN